MPTEDPDEKRLGMIFPLTFSGVSTMDLFESAPKIVITVLLLVRTESNSNISS